MTVIGTIAPDAPPIVHSSDSRLGKKIAISKYVTCYNSQCCCRNSDEKCHFRLIMRRDISIYYIELIKMHWTNWLLTFFVIQFSKWLYTNFCNVNTFKVLYFVIVILWQLYEVIKKYLNYFVNELKTDNSSKALAQPGSLKPPFQR